MGLGKNSESLLVGRGGFTLVEIVIALLVSSLVMAGVISSYLAQQRVQSTEEQIVGMQQNLRVGMNLMIEDMRMAGSNPDGAARDASCNKPGSAGVVPPGIHTATASEFGFSMDIDGDGDCDSVGENVTYNIFNDTEGIPTLGRRVSATENVAKADHIEAIGFYYTLENGSQVSSPAVGQFEKIRAVEVSLLARTADPVRGYRNTHTYMNGSGTPWDLNGAGAGNAANDSFRRQLLTLQVTCRNMGL